MKSLISKGIICVKDDFNIEYRVCIIEYELYEDESFEYRFIPNYKVIDLLDATIFQGIPGLNLDLRKEMYIRKNRIPVFIAERVPSKNSIDYYDQLEAVGMTYMEPIQYLIKDKRKYSGDNFYVINYEEPKTVSLSDIESKANSLGIIKLILDQITANNRVILADGTEISNSSVFKTLHHIYKKQIQVLKEQQKNGIDKAKQAGKYKGRKPIKVDRLLFLELSERVNRKEITNKEAAKRLGISIDKYYRYKKQYKGKDIVLL